MPGRHLLSREYLGPDGRFKAVSLTMSMTAAVVFRLVDLGTVGLEGSANGLVTAFHTRLHTPDLIPTTIPATAPNGHIRPARKETAS